MAIAAWDPGQPRITVSGSSMPRILQGNLEANSQTFKAGHFVYLNSGAVTYYPGGDIPVAGVALKDATNVTSGNIAIPILALEPGMEVYIQTATSGDVLEDCNTTCVVGVAYDTNADVTKPSYIDSSDTTNGCFVFLGPLYDALGDVDSWGRFMVSALENQVSTP